MKIAIFGVNGFIGSHLLSALLEKTDHEIVGFDCYQQHIQSYLQHPRFHFQTGDIALHHADVEFVVKQCDVILPLAAIATPATYVQQPLKIFELDFEANLQIVRYCVQYRKRLIFPSTSEVYGMCSDNAFSEESSHFVLGPIAKERWIYASCKQLLDRLIYAYAKQDQLDYTLFRPFNWIGPRLDNIYNSKAGGSRVVTQFLGNILRGENLQLVDNGVQQRCLLDVDDGIDALLKIIENKDGKATQQILNIGEPNNNITIRAIAEKLLALCAGYPVFQKNIKQCEITNISAHDYYGPGYQDVGFRVPDIQKITSLLGWQSHLDVDAILEKTVAYYGNET